MPLVALTNTATRREGSDDAMRALEAWTMERATIVASKPGDMAPVYSRCRVQSKKILSYQRFRRLSIESGQQEVEFSRKSSRCQIK
jgi:hypothetical protein